jgi:hypothetical protein
MRCDSVTRPGLQGKLIVRFAIGGSGYVASSCLVRTTLSAPDVERCIVDLVLNWSFPRRLGGDWALVEYPFVLTPQSADTEVRAAPDAGLARP